MSKNYDTAFTSTGYSGGSLKRAGFLVASSDVVPIGTDNLAPDKFSGLALLTTNQNFISNETLGAVQNISGRTLKSLSGSISFQPTRTGGGAFSQIYLWSERSTDGVNWTLNNHTLRQIPVPNDGETFKTAVSLTIGWHNLEFIRFKFYNGGGGVVTFTPSTTTVDNGVIEGYSVIWEMGEV